MFNSDMDRKEQALATTISTLKALQKDLASIHMETARLYELAYKHTITVPCQEKETREAFIELTKELEHVKKDGSNVFKKANKITKLLVSLERELYGSL